MAARLFTKSDVFYFFALNLASGFMLSAAHNVLYFVLDVKSLVVHFLHYFFTFGVLSIFRIAKVIPQQGAVSNELKNAAYAKLFECLIASFAHSHNRTGELYLVRIFDFAYTIAVTVFYSRSSTQFVRPASYLLIPFSVFVSLSWLEIGQLEYTSVSFVAAIILPFSKAASMILLKEAFEKTGRAHLDGFLLQYSRAVSGCLLIPAIVSAACSRIEVTASWESIDFILMALSFLFMFCNVYSELWMMNQLNQNAFLALDNSKYLFASVGQWVIQNMAHPNLIAFGAKMVAFTCLLRILTQ